MQREQIDFILSASSDQLVVAGQYCFEKEPEALSGLKRNPVMIHGQCLHRYRWALHPPTLILDPPQTA